MTVNTIQASLLGVDTMMLWASGPTVELFGGGIQEAAEDYCICNVQALVKREKN
jgi:hypothetical protein